MVHLRTLETTNDRVARKVYKLALIKRLYEQGFSREDIINLYNLIDWIMTLTKDLEREFQEELSKYEEEKKMPYITSIERAGQLKGELIGELKGNQKLVIKLLNRRIGELKPLVIEQIRKLPVEQLEELAEALLDFSTVANLEEWLKARPKPVEE
jgi:predicted transposase YdaD